MKQQIDELAQWCYRGIWGVITGWFMVPETPPALPPLDQEAVKSFKPAKGFLDYLRFFFWVGLVIVDVIFTAIWIAIFIWNPLVGLLITPLALSIIVLPDVIVYIAIHLRYDTTWYVLSDRSLRIRRGIWVIHETTLTFENIQNVNVRQGPIQRWFKIADLMVSTAGGGGGVSAESGHGASLLGPHVGLIEGIANANEIRELIMNRIKSSRSGGLGDEHHPSVAPSRSNLDAPVTMSPAHLEVLGEIRNLTAKLAN